MGLNGFIVHGHFYQPPREDPFTGVVPQEYGADPFPNWNERIYTECYRPNVDLGNFERISFNLGPTLFTWLQKHDPLTAARIIAQDRANLQRFGVGNAMAQAYNHTILPLAKRSDKELQIAWGIADFAHRFGRQPQGMWLPETAMDLESLQIMAQRGIRFTILAPWQAEALDLDTSQPYRVALPQGQEISVFFYQSELSGSLSFDPQMSINADRFAEQRLLAAFDLHKTRRGQPQVLTLATDGELYGHHQKLRERFLARLVDGATSRLDLHPVYPALWLQTHPAQEWVRLRERTSWSCHHGIGRWAGGCACTPGGGAWKSALRAAFDRLSDELDGLYFEAAARLVSDPALLRERYIAVLLGQVDFAHLVGQMSDRVLKSAEQQRLEQLLRSQFERQRMFTSCGWFFEDLDRIEPRNNLAYAAQAVSLAQSATGINLAPLVLRELTNITSPRTSLSAAALFHQHLQRTQFHN